MSEQTDNRIRTILKSGGFLFLALGFEMGVSFVAKLLIGNVLGPFNYGSVALGITLMGFSSTIVLLGLHTGVGRYMPRYDDPAARRGLVVSAFQLFLPIALLVSGGIVVFAPTIAAVAFSEPSLAPVLRVFGVAIPLGALVNFASGCAQGNKTSLPRVVIRHITLPLTRFGGIVVALTVCGAAAPLCSEVVGVSYAYLASYIIAGSIAGYYLLRHTSLASFELPAPSKHQELLAFSVPLVITAVMTHVFSDLDTLMLGYFKDPAAVGIYQVVYPLGELLVISLTAFRFIFVPILSELHAEQNYSDMQRLYKIITKWVTMGTLPLFLVLALFPRLVINLTFGAAYNAGSLALSVLAVAFFVHAVAGLNSGALTSIGGTRIIMYDNVLVAAVNIVLNVLLIPPYGFLGAAVATAVSYFLLNGLYSVQLYRRTGAQPFSPALLRPVAVALGLVGIVYTLGRALFEINTVMLVVFGILFVLGYGVAILRFGGIEEEEVMLVLSFEERFGVDLGPFKAVANRIIPD